jgi:signal transduction histidine kinase
MPLSFRRRLFLGLVVLTALPLATALTALALYVRTTGSPAGPRAAIDEIAASGRDLIAAVDTNALDDASRAALAEHTEVIAQRTILARRAERLSRSAAALLGAGVLLASALVVGLAVLLAGRWSRRVSAPIEELVRWVRGIERGEPPPEPDPNPDEGGPPEFETLRQALREMATALEEARNREVERERLTAFRETARRVAHEMRGPLNASQLALRRLAVVDHDERHNTAVGVLADETDRLRRLADEFSTFGRLPEGSETDIDVVELLESVLASAVPTHCPILRSLAPGLRIHGRYEVLRRAVENVVRNAVEATDDRGISVRAASDGDQVRITIADHGQGISAAIRSRIFQPYVTTKERGTGLGLTIAHQAAVSHGGSLLAKDAVDGGAAFTFTFPAP